MRKIPGIFDTNGKLPYSKQYQILWHVRAITKEIPSNKNTIKNPQKPYPEIDDANLKGTLWTFKQWLVLKMLVRCGISFVLILTYSYKTFSGY